MDYHDVIEDATRAADEVVVPVCEGIEGPRIHRTAAHRIPPAKRRPRRDARDDSPTSPARLLRSSVQPTGSSGRARDRRRLQVDEGAGREPAVALEPATGFRQHGGVEGRIEENQVELLPRGVEVASGVRADHLSAVTSEVAQPLEQVPRHGRLDVHEHDVRGAARQRLEPQRAAAREQVEAPAADHPLLEPVEQRLAHSVRRRPDARDCGKPQ
jgi:hypothetical protein